jgi:hypothetical protein
MAKMRDVNFLILDRIENKITKAREDNHAHVRLIDLAALSGAPASPIAVSMRRATTRDAATGLSLLT